MTPVRSLRVGIIDGCAGTKVLDQFLRADLLVPFPGGTIGVPRWGRAKCLPACNEGTMLHRQDGMALLWGDPKSVETTVFGVPVLVPDPVVVVITDGRGAKATIRRTKQLIGKQGRILIVIGPAGIEVPEGGAVDVSVTWHDDGQPTIEVSTVEAPSE